MSEPPNTTLGDRLARHLPAALFVAVALTQIYFVYEHKLSPWKGGGWGLFSTLDQSSNRRIACLALDAQGRPCRVYPGFSGRGVEAEFDQRFREELRAFPYDVHLRRLARMLLNADFVPADEVTHGIIMRGASRGRLPGNFRLRSVAKEPVRILRPLLPSDGPVPPDSLVRLKAVRLDVWRLRFDAATRRMSWERLGPPLARGDWQ